MEKVTRTKEIEEVVYVSIDGKEFQNEDDCRRWENSYDGMMEKSWLDFRKIEANSLLPYIEYSADDDHCYIVRPETMEEVAFLNAYRDFVQGYVGVGNAIGVDCVGKLLIFHHTCGNYVDVYDFEEYLANVTSVFEKAKSDFERKESENGKQES